MNAWRQLVDAAVRGADGQTHWADLDDPAAALLRELDPRAPEHALLAAAGVLALYRAAGQEAPRLTMASAVPAPAPHRECDAASAALLARVLDHGHDPMLPDVLARLAAHGLTVPAALAPQLLARFANAASLRATVAAVIGAPGRQLAAENPAWLPLSPAVESWDGLVGLWHGADMSRRRHLLAQVRGRDPALGRALLDVHWRQLSAQGREPLIQALETGLSMDDEPFLETVLDDRVHTVRRKAAELLARLPASRLAQRMADAAMACLAWSPDADAAIAVRPPETIPAAGQRDGVTAYARGDRVRWQGAQLTYMIGCVPLHHWEETWQTTPARVVDAALAGRWPRTLTTGLAQAAAAQHNHVWAATILPACDFALHVLRVVPVLQPAQLDALIRAHAPADTPLDSNALLVKLVRRWPHVWTETLASRWVEAVTATLDATAPDAALDRILVTALRDFALRAPPRWHAAAAAQWQPRLHVDVRSRAGVHEALALLALRAQLDTLLPDPAPAT